MISLETKHPRRNIPIAFIAAILLTGGFFLVVTYAQVLGFGTDKMNDLLVSESPLSDLATRFVSKHYAFLIDSAVMISAFACAMGTLTAASWMLGTLGHAVDRQPDFVVREYATPRRALMTISLLTLCATLVCGHHTDGISYAGQCAAIGSIALIVVYVWVCLAELLAAWRTKAIARVIVSLLATHFLVWPLWGSIYPRHPYPILWPPLVMTWIVIGVVLGGRSQRAELGL